MKKTAALIATAMMLTSTTAAADAIGVYVGAQVWDMATDGSHDVGVFQDEFRYDDETQARYYIELEHPIPFIPNAKIARSELMSQGTETSGFGDTEIDLSYTDYTLYYELFDNDLFAFDFGITAKDLSGDIDDDNLDEIVPMLYASAQVGLPLTGLSLFAEGNFLSLDDHTFADYQAGIAYALIDNMVIDVNLSVGYRAVTVDIDDLDGITADLDFDGAFAGVEVHF
ncbi:hypothetical protein A9Q98_10830 [Thalassotalea sp. 42_200_T64]|nr:hypothetical protein A9Q98_10830 [Thalassotalea sp. 42_200_T64]